MVLNKYAENIWLKKVFDKLDYFKKIFLNRNIVFFILTLFLSMQNFIGQTYPFSYAMLAVASLFDIPFLLVIVPAVLGLIIAKVSILYIIKLFIFFILFTIVTTLINIEGVNKKYSVLIKLFVVSVIIEILSILFGNIGLSNIATSLFNVLSIVSFYFIFIYGMYVLMNLNKEFVFSKEELIAMAAVLAIAFGTFKDIGFNGFSLFYVLTIILVLIFGWKNGSVLGCTSGFIVGLLVEIISNDTQISFILSLAFAGLISGLLRKFGKLCLSIGFILGELAINYWINGFSQMPITFIEMIVASVIIFILPKKLEKKLDNVFDQNKAMKRPYDEVLDYGSDVKNRLNAVSEIFDDLSSITIPTTIEDDEETRKIIKRYIVEFIENNCYDCEKKEKCIDEQKINSLVDYIASKLEANEKINYDMIDFKCVNSEELVENIKEIYNSMKLVRMMKQKENENSSKISQQYKEVANIIASISKNIVRKPPVIQNKLHEKLKNELKIFGYLVYEDQFIEEDNFIEYTFVTDILTDIENQENQITRIVSNILEQNMVVKLILNSSKTEKSKIKLISTPKYDVDVGIVSLNKSGENISGDSYISMENSDLKHFCVLSDGAGSGIEASKSSKLVINMFEKLLKGGFDRTKVIEIINSVIKLKSDKTFSTIDALIVDLKTADSEYIKVGAAPSYIIEDSKVITINNHNLPVGLVNDNEYVPIVRKLKNYDIIIQVSDGIVTDKMDVNNNYFKEYIKNIDVNKSARNIADEISKFILKENSNILKDDTTVIVTKLKENII